MEAIYQNDKMTTKTPLTIEKNLDKIILQKMRGESALSPLKYTPSYQNDQISRLILYGNRSMITPNPNNQDIYKKPYNSNGYFSNVQHQYLNNRNYYDRLWNLNKNNEEYETKQEYSNPNERQMVDRDIKEYIQF